MHTLCALQAINLSTARQAVFTLTVTFDGNNRTSIAEEAEGLISIFQRYFLCHGSILLHIQRSVINLSAAVSLASVYVSVCMCGALVSQFCSACPARQTAVVVIALTMCCIHVLCAVAA